MRARARARVCVCVCVCVCVVCMLVCRCISVSVCVTRVYTHATNVLRLLVAAYCRRVRGCAVACRSGMTYTKDMPLWAHVGLYPKHAYLKLKVKTFFEAACLLRVKKKSDAAIIVGWSYCFGLTQFPVAGLQPDGDYDSENYETFKSDFWKIYGPPGLLYPGAKPLVRVTQESAEESGLALEQVEKKNKWYNKANDAAGTSNAMWRKLFYSGFHTPKAVPYHEPTVLWLFMIGHSLGRVETCFGPSTQGAGTKTHLKSRFCAILKKRGAMIFGIDAPPAGD